MKNSERMLRINEARQKFFDVLTEGVDMLNTNNLDPLQRISLNLNKAIETACFLDMECDNIRGLVAEKFIKALNTDRESYINEYGIICGLVCSRFNKTGKHEICFDNYKVVVRYYFEKVADYKDIERWKFFIGS